MMLLFALALLIYSILSSGSISKANGAISSITINWNSPYIEDLAWVRDDMPCPDGFEIAATYPFPGTVQYCECRHFPYFSTSGIYTTSSCRDSKHHYVDYGCTEVRIDPATLSSWRNRDKLCKKTTHQLTYKINMDVKVENESCPENTIRCGGTLEHEYVCVPLDFGKCPVSEIWIGDANPNPSKYGEAVISKTGGDNIFIARGTTLPLVLSKFEEYWPCVDPTKLSRTPTRDSISYLEKSKDICEKDERFKKLTTLDEFNFFRSNYLDTNRLSRIDLARSEYIYGLFVQNSIPINKWCKDKLQDFINFGSIIDSVSGTLTGLFIFSIIAGIIMIGLSIWGCCELPKENSSVWTIRSVITVVLIGICFLWIYFGFRKLNSKEYNIESVTQSKCSDAFTNGSLERMKIDFDAATSHMEEIFYFSMVFIILYILVLVGHYAIAERERRDRDQLPYIADNDQLIRPQNPATNNYPISGSYEMGGGGFNPQPPPPQVSPYIPPVYVHPQKPVNGDSKQILNTNYPAPPV